MDNYNLSDCAKCKNKYSFLVGITLNIVCQLLSILLIYLTTLRLQEKKDMKKK